MARGLAATGRAATVMERGDVRSQASDHLLQVPNLVTLQTILATPVVAVTAQGVDCRRICRGASEKGRIMLSFGRRESNVVTSRSKGKVRDPRITHSTLAVFMGDYSHVSVESP
jgi:hypothetical protein